MAKFTLTIECNNEVFDDWQGEVGRMLRVLGNKLEASGRPIESGALHDVNGNHVGSFEYHPDSLSGEL